MTDDLAAYTREANRLEQALYTAEGTRDDAADLIAWSLRTIKQNHPDRWAVLLAALAADFTDADAQVDRWIQASRDVDAARDALNQLPGG